MTDNKLLLCYNKGCGQKFDPESNGPESCRHHTGEPIFHDAYKSWSCCKKRCIDFTEFLNIKGCSVSPHNNVKPAEPQPPVKDQQNSDEVVVVRQPVEKAPSVERPSFDAPLTTLKPEVTDSLKQVLENLKSVSLSSEYNGEGSIPIGTSCKNNACKQTYEGPQTLTSQCTYHPGSAIFHEGLKYWSCCTKRTTDFKVFLEQIGCTIGSHTWFKEQTKGHVNCRLDWHQTGPYVFISVYGKKCDPSKSTIEISPVRAKLSLFFPEQDGYFTKDMELKGIIDVASSSAVMMPTKVEIKLKKLLPGSWSNVEIPRTITTPVVLDAPVKEDKQEDEPPADDYVDLSSI